MSLQEKRFIKQINISFLKESKSENTAKEEGRTRIMATAVYPGSFDPITFGHLDIIKRTAAVFDKVIIGVLINKAKKPFFSVEERVELIKEVTKDIPNVEIVSFNGLLIDFSDKMKADVIVRGIRAVSDFEYELMMAQTNKQLHLTEILHRLFRKQSADGFMRSSDTIRNGNHCNWEDRKMADMDSVKLLEEIAIYIDNCKTAGVLSSGSMIKVNREELISMLDEVRNLLPKEIAESRRIVRNQDKIIADAKSRAERIMQNAAKEAGGMVDDQEIVSMANMRAEDILSRAQKDASEVSGSARETAREVQIGALKYTQNMLEGLEYMYSTIIKEEKEYFNSVLEKLKKEQKQIMADKQEIDMQLNAGIRTGRTKEDFEKKEEPAEE